MTSGWTWWNHPGWGAAMWPLFTGIEIYKEQWAFAIFGAYVSGVAVTRLLNGIGK